MKSNKNSPVIAVGLDAAEPLLIRQMIEQGEMPTLKSLLQEGQWLNVKSPSDIGSGAVWPTFITGDWPAKHGIHAEWSWQPDTMGLQRYSGSNLQPFWKTLADQGFRVGILDVPFAPQVNLKEGFEIVEWGAHDFLEGVLRTAPDSITDFVDGDFPPHPFSLDRLDTGGPDDKPGLERLTKGCLEGAKLRGTLARRLLAMTDPNLAIIVFTEIHHSAHYLWHTVSPDDALYKQHLSNHSESIKPGIKDIYSEIDTRSGLALD